MCSNPPGISCDANGQVCHGDRPSRAGIWVVSLLAQLVLISLVAVTPWLYGGVQRKDQVWLFAGALVALACWWIVQLANRPGSAVLPVALIPLAGAVGLGVLQLVPLGEKAGRLLSPKTAELRAELLPAKASPEESLPESLGVPAINQRQPLSLYPASTRRDLALLLLGTATFLLGAVFFRTPRAQLWLCGLVAVNGATLAFFGLVQRITWNGLLYWTVPLTSGGRPFGPFVSRTNAGGYLNLCLAGAVGMTIWAVGRGRVGGSGRIPSPLSVRRPLLARGWEHLTACLAGLNGLVIVALSLTGCIIAGVLCSLSRGAGVAMVGAAVVTVVAVLCARRRTFRLWSIGLAALGGLALASWAGTGDSVHARFATLLDRQTISQTRIPHWRDGLKAAADFWRCGSGLGTYRYVYRPYQERPSDAWYLHAENQYLEALVEGGFTGLGLMLAMIGLVGVAAWQLLRHDPDPEAVAFGIAATFALASQAIHAFFDFGLYIPANMILFAILCGAVSGRAAHLAKWRLAPRLLALPRARLISASLAVSVFAAVLWSCLETSSAAAVETSLKNARFAQAPREVSRETLHEAIEQLQAAVGRRQDDAEAQYRLAMLWLHLHRASAYEQLRGETREGETDPGLWEATSTVVLHGQAHHFARNSLRSELEQLRNEPGIRDHLVPALEHLGLARRACPLLPEVHVSLAELSFLVTDPAEDRIHIERSLRLSPPDADLLRRCGLLELQAGRDDLACERWRRSLTLSSDHLDDVLYVASQELGLLQTIEKVLPDSPALLVELAQQRYQADGHVHVRFLLAERARSLVDTTDLPEEERHYLRGAALALTALYPKAIAEVSRAVKLRPRYTPWRYELAVLLEKQGRISEAHEQAVLCARMDPDNDEYRRLLEGINRTRITAGTRLE